MKFIILTSAIILSSCITKSKFDNHADHVAKEIKTLKYQLKTHSYLSNTSNCFVGLNTCLHAAVSKDERHVCVKKHERCVINVYRRYKDLWSQ